MARTQKSKRVSWPPDVNLCQIRLFLSEDAPSQSGSGSQDHLQAKTSWMVHSLGVGTDDHLPPGFEAPQPSMPKIPVIKWRCPPWLLLNPAWQVVAGEESKEVDAQKQREMRVLEAVYPRISAIPPSPCVAPDAYDQQVDEFDTPLIPLTPVEDEIDASELDPSISPFEISKKQSLSSSLRETGTLRPLPEKSPGNNVPPVPSLLSSDKPPIDITSGAEPDVVAAATAAFTAIMRTNEAGSLIDRDLLIKILSNPNLLDQLVKEYGVATKIKEAEAGPVNPTVTASVTMSVPAQPVNINQREAKTPAPGTPLSSPAFPASSVAGLLNPASTPPVAPALNLRPSPAAVPHAASTSTLTMTPVLKDVNYYKSLIQQHGEEKQETPDHSLLHFAKRQNLHNLSPSMETNPQNPKPRGKIQKPCMYFNTPRGCRHGVNCAYVHDASFQQRVVSAPEVQSAKRMKLEGELTGRG